MTVIVAVGQFAPTEHKQANLDTIGGFARQARSQGAALLTLPEYASFMAPRLDERIVAASEPLDGPFVTALGEMARTLDIAIVAGFNERIEGERRVHNTVVLVDSGGTVAGTYRKLHLYDAFGGRESERIAPGEPGVVATMSVGELTVAAQTCYDLRFPEVTRTLVDAGADLVLLPAQWVPGPLKEDHWVTLLRARAIENTVYIAAAGQSAPLGSGRSMVVDPMGVVVAAMGEGVGVALAAVDRHRLDDVRDKNPSLRARRFEVRPRARGGPQ